MKKIIQSITKLIIFSIVSMSSNANLYYSASELNFLFSEGDFLKKENNEEEIKKIKNKLKLIDKSAESFVVETTSIKDYYKVSIGNEKYYINKDVSHMFTGEAISLSGSTPVFLDEDKNKKERRVFIQTLDDNEGIIFEAEKERDRLYVFTDITCPYCKALHKDIEAINKKGITIVYFPYSRSGLNTVVNNALNTIWCNKKNGVNNDYTIAIKNPKSYISENQKNSCINNNDDFTKYYFTVANQLGLRGTPFIINKKGDIIGGYEGYTQFLIRITKTW